MNPMSRMASAIVVSIAASLVAAGCSTGASGGAGATGGAGGGTGGTAGAGGQSGDPSGSGGAGAGAGGAAGRGGSTDTTDSGASGNAGAGGGGTPIDAAGDVGGATTESGTALDAGGTAREAGTTEAGGTTCTATTLKAAANCTGRLFGAALAASHLNESGYATAAREHSFVTPENEMKWDQIEPTRGAFNFGPGDQIVNFAMQNGLQIKGHTLVWHKQLPTWVTDLTNPSDIRAAMLAHISGVMSHYKGRVTAWDVVNEAWVVSGDAGVGPPVIRDSVFSSALGPGFIDEAFTAARQADSGALLIYNEFGNEGLSDKATAVYNMIKDMKTRGIPIDGVGLQMHIGFNTAPTAGEVAQNMQRFADLGVKVFISEMDVNGCAGYSLDQERTQYHDMVAACVAQPACAAVTVWGITDKFSWLNSDTRTGCATGQLPLPLLWDDNYGKKSAYAGALDALLGR
jgi:endo-1,4-beta-xylanase